MRGVLGVYQERYAGVEGDGPGFEEVRAIQVERCSATRVCAQVVQQIDGVFEQEREGCAEIIVTLGTPPPRVLN